MKEKKSIKVSLGTVVCICIIFVLIIIIGGMYFYYNLNPNKLSNKTYNDTMINVNNSNNLVPDDIVNVEYVCENFENHFLNQCVYLKFYPTNTFDASLNNYNYQEGELADSYKCRGTYEIEENKIKCIIKEATRQGELIDEKYAQNNIEFVLEYKENEHTMQLTYISTNKLKVYHEINKNNIEEIELSVLKENNIFREYKDNQIESDSTEELNFLPTYYELNSNGEDVTMFVWRKLCKHF